MLRTSSLCHVEIKSQKPSNRTAYRRSELNKAEDRNQNPTKLIVTTSNATKAIHSYPSSDPDILFHHLWSISTYIFTMDYEGQRLSELIFYWLIIGCGGVGWWARETLRNRMTMARMKKHQDFNLLAHLSTLIRGFIRSIWLWRQPSHVSLSVPHFFHFSSWRTFLLQGYRILSTRIFHCIQVLACGSGTICGCKSWCCHVMSHSSGAGLLSGGEFQMIDHWWLNTVFLNLWHLFRNEMKSILISRFALAFLNVVRISIERVQI